ncbi:hypothetical protein MMPV_009862 [Pyropia vietnamensis]
MQGAPQNLPHESVAPIASLTGTLFNAAVRSVAAAATPAPTPSPRAADYPLASVMMVPAPVPPTPPATASAAAPRVAPALAPAPFKAIVGSSSSSSMVTPSSSGAGPANDDEAGNGASVTAGEYRCLINGCGRTFQRSSNLDAHTRLHTQEAPFSCDLCKRNFLWKSSLLAHVRSLSHTEAAARAAQEAEGGNASGGRVNAEGVVLAEGAASGLLTPAPSANSAPLSSPSSSTASSPALAVASGGVVKPGGRAGGGSCKDEDTPRKRGGGNRTRADGQNFHCPYAGCSREFPFQLSLITHVRAHKSGKRTALPAGRRGTVVGGRGSAGGAGGNASKTPPANGRGGGDPPPPSGGTSSIARPPPPAGATRPPPAPPPPPPRQRPAAGEAVAAAATGATSRAPPSPPSPLSPLPAARRSSRVGGSPARRRPLRRTPPLVLEPEPASVAAVMETPDSGAISWGSLAHTAFSVRTAAESAGVVDMDPYAYGPPPLTLGSMAAPMDSASDTSVGSSSAFGSEDFGGSPSTPSSHKMELLVLGVRDDGGVLPESPPSPFKLEDAVHPVSDNATGVAGMGDSTFPSLHSTLSGSSWSSESDGSHAAGGYSPLPFEMEFEGMW